MLFSLVRTRELAVNTEAPDRRWRFRVGPIGNACGQRTWRRLRTSAVAHNRTFRSGRVQPPRLAEPSTNGPSPREATRCRARHTYRPHVVPAAPANRCHPRSPPLALALLASLAHPGTARADTCALPDPGAPYELVFEEDFDGDSLDRNRWNTEFLWGPGVVINGELQYYVNREQFGHDPFEVSDGILTIEAIKTPVRPLAALPHARHLLGHRDRAPVADAGRCPGLRGARRERDARRPPERDGLPAPGPPRGHRLHLRRDRARCARQPDRHRAHHRQQRRPADPLPARAVLPRRRLEALLADGGRDHLGPAEPRRPLRALPRRAPGAPAGQPAVQQRLRGGSRAGKPSRLPRDRLRSLRRGHRERHDHARHARRSAAARTTRRTACHRGAHLLGQHRRDRVAGGAGRGELRRLRRHCLRRQYPRPLALRR